MDFDDQSETRSQFNTLSMGHTLTAPLNNTLDFLVRKIIRLFSLFFYIMFREPEMSMVKQHLLMNKY